MVLGGLWHGAAWTFVIWGTFHGLVLCVYRVVEGPLRRWAARLSSAVRRPWRLVAVVFFFHLVCISWLFFRAETWSQAITLLGALVSEPTRNASRALAALGPFWPSFWLVTALLVVQSFQYLKQDRWVVFRSPALVRGFVYAVSTLLFVWAGEDGGEAFIYFQF
jgi:D-alanyl-lipoteichoic acid acyltransferase DltB (MBOAT superfamily)